jgi:hypothetical protein
MKCVVPASSFTYLLRLFRDLNIPAASLNVALHDAAKATDWLFASSLAESDVRAA